MFVFISHYMFFKESFIYLFILNFVIVGCCFNKYLSQKLDGGIIMKCHKI